MKDIALNDQANNKTIGVVLLLDVLLLFYSPCRKRLEDSRKLWQFYWDMADEENWIKEKEQIVSVDDIGHDLTTGELRC